VGVRPGTESQPWRGGDLLISKALAKGVDILAKQTTWGKSKVVSLRK